MTSAAAASSEAPRRRDQMRAFVCRVGHLLLPPHELERIAQELEDNWFDSRESLQALTRECAEQLDIPVALADALRNEALDGRLLQRYSGRVPPLRTAIGQDSLFEAEEAVTPGSQALHKGYLTWEERENERTWMPFDNGFPSQLRGYAPTSPPRGRTNAHTPQRRRSPCEPRAENQHIERQRRAQQMRQELTQELRISNSRREVLVDPWRHSSTCRRPRSPVMCNARQRSIAGAQWSAACREMTREVAPTMPDGKSCPPLVGGGSVRPRSSSPMSSRGPQLLRKAQRA